ncbi:hypothetical protein CANCADRAFT_57007 [Tortispora caseinolytica NRRL Y-17796]|uniref:Amino acid transporter transmembrane domain-containing protein n=1 Tax=Tortispora caseinolytica NRRL Y-17796 TaxID=767744 RepID=A0A1E4TFB1_9ASCO|nr:hypothetical protein CANCADRAFT_57007 [Tortispora caseinolytica NRRL Y-17796]
MTSYAELDKARNDGPSADDIEHTDVIANLNDSDEEPFSSFVIEDKHLAVADDKSSVHMAFMNMANSIIGAGVIGQPYAMRQSGLVAGILIMIALTLIIDWTLRLMIVNAKLSGTSTYQGTVEHCFGRWGRLTISLAQCAFAFGGAAAFAIIMGDTITGVITALFPSLSSVPVLGIFAYRRPVILLFSLGVALPLSLNRHIAKLSQVSMIALMFMTIIVACIIIGSASLPTDLKGSFSLSLWTITPNFMGGISVISFAFVCHHNTLLIYDSLKKPTLDRFFAVTHWSTGFSMIVCMVVALAGFIPFGDKTQGNILNNYPHDSIPINIARFCFGLNMLTTMPLEIFVCREVLLDYFYPGYQYVKKLHVISTVVLVLAAVTVSLATCNLGIVLELIGATAASTLAYILPPMCYIKLSSKPAGSMIHAYCGVAFGVTLLIGSSVQSILKAFSEHHTVVCRP